MEHQSNVINTWALSFQLNEAARATMALRENIKRGECDDMEATTMGFEFEHILGHLCLAWHVRLKNDTELKSADHSGFEAMMHSVPQWRPSIHLVEVDEPRQFDQRPRSVPYGTINRAGMLFHLHELSVGLNGLIDDINEKKLDPRDQYRLAERFERPTTCLLMAWHSKWMNSTAIGGAHATDLMRDSLPNWGICLRIVDIDEVV
jgi:hypothetical protein